MTTKFPSEKDDTTSLPVEAGSEQLSVNHVPSHQNLSDAVIAIEDKLGIDSSADSDSIDYKINNIDHTEIANIGSNTHAEIDTHIADTTNPHSVTKTQVGLGDVENLKVKLDATTAPTADDDSGDGYSVGSVWVDVTNDRAYVCTDSTATAAVWVRGVEDHTELTNIGSNTHAQIDTHIANVSNPHSVDIDDVTPTTTKGDIIIEDGSNAIRVAIGSNNQVLTADSAQASGVKWETVAAASNNTYIATAGQNIAAGDAVSTKSVQDTHSIDLELSSSQYLSVVDSASLSITGDITIEAWIKLEQLPSVAGNTFTVVGKRAAGNSSYQFIVNSTDDKLGILYSGDGTNLTQLESTTALGAGNVGVWTHIAVTVDVSAKTATFYIDSSSDTGVFVSGTQTSIFDGNAPLYIGANETAAAFLDGMLDDVRIWSDIRTAQEISDSYDTVLIGIESNLQAYWKLDNTLLDETSNNNDLTNNNAASFSTSVPSAMDILDGYVYVANSLSTSDSDGFLGFAESSITKGNSGDIIIGGQLTGLTGLTQGSGYYLSDTPGAVSSSVGTVTRKVGIANSATTLVITNIW